MKAVTSAQMRALDQRTIAAGTPGELLMERAGFAVARAVTRHFPRRDARTVVLLAGKGNNGGDAFVAARHLAGAGCEATLVLLARRQDIQGDALIHFQQLVGARVVEQPTADELQALLLETRPAVVVDGLLGTGLGGDVREPYAAAIRIINDLPRLLAPGPAPVVLAIDLPSGLDSETGEPHGVALRAAETITMGLPKIGLLRPAALDYVGRLTVANLGFPAEFVAAIATDVELITAEDIGRLFPPRPHAAHKGDFGHLLIIAGAEGYTGAPVLCAAAAARSGVGLVTLAVPRAIYPIVAARCPPEIMPRPFDDWAVLRHEAATAGYNAVAVGPGLGRHGPTQAGVTRLVAELALPLVIDADALNALARDPAPLRHAPAARVLTPHPGEMGRLIGKTAAEVQADRWSAARGFARDHRVTLVLKGAGTVVADPDGPLGINLTGNPGLAKGGMGDVLTGVIGALLAQGLDPAAAARAGVFLHGRAGDLAAQRHGEIAVQAGDVIAALAEAFRQGPGG